MSDAATTKISTVIAVDPTVSQDAIFAAEIVSRVRLSDADLDRLRAEVADLKAKADPLAEMWRELSEYQPIADRDGHGESWARMCEERTETAAWRAADSVKKAGDAWQSAIEASHSARDASRAKAIMVAADVSADEAKRAIRKAKQVQP